MWRKHLALFRSKALHRESPQDDSAGPSPKVSRIPFLLSGLLALPAYPPLNLFFFSWFSLLPLIRNSRGLSPWMAFRRGWWGGLIFNAGLLYWIALNSGAGTVLAFLSYVGLLLVMPLYWGAFTALWAWTWKRWGNLSALLLPAFWVGLEIIKNLPEIGFPWQELGLSQIGLLPVAQLAELGGIRLLSAWVVFLNVALFLLFEKKQRIALPILILLLISLGWGAWRMNHLPEGGVKFSALLVQGNVDPASKWQEDPDSSLAIYERLTRAGIGSGKLDLILWPETAIPVYLAYQLSEQRRLRLLAKELNVPILTGAPHYELKRTGGYLRYNSAFLFPADGSVPQRYDKIRLVPFGERVPFQKWFPAFGELNLGQAEFTPGKRYTLFELQNHVKIAAQICFESVFGEEFRRFVQEGARLLCNLTNDGWYGNSSGPYQHANLVRFRAIETRCPLIRAANTGISMAVDRSGRITDRIPYGLRGALTVHLQEGGSYQTIYVRYGEVIPTVLALTGLAGLILAAFVHKPKDRP
jgi:apolipoprotein N-acyltransferase